MKRIPEESTGWLTLSFKDKDGEADSPPSFDYRVDTKEGKELRGWTTVSNPGGTYELVLKPTDNEILDSNLSTDSTGSYQTNIVTVRVQFGTDDAHNDTFKYEVRDLERITAET